MESGVNEARVSEPRRGSIKMERYSPPSGTWIREVDLPWVAPTVIQIYPFGERKELWNEGIKELKYEN